MPRIISIWLPTLAWRGAIGRTRKRPASSPSTGQDESRPLVLVDTVKNAQVLSAVDDAAAAAGLAPGMTLSHARALIPDIETAPVDPENDRANLEKLADWCGRYSPSFGVDDSARDCAGDDHGLWIDSTGAAHLFGGEEVMLADLSDRLNRFGLRHRLGLADSFGAAWALARHGREVRNIAPGHVHEALKGLGVAGLRLAPEIVTLLRRLGLKTIGQLEALPRIALAKRFSSKEAYESVLLRLDQCFGRQEEPLTPKRPPPVYRVEQAFLEPLTEPEAFAHGLRLLTSDLCRKLIRAHEGAERLAFLAFRVDGDVKAIKVGTSRPTRDPKHIDRLFAEKLPMIDPGFGIEKLALHAERTAPIETSQGKLEGGGAGTSSEDERFDQLIDRLANRLGAEAVTVTVPIESHIPEEQAAQVTPGTPQKSWADMPHFNDRPSCLLLWPEPIKALAEVPDGPPLRFTWRRVTRRIVKSEGPERIAPNWGNAVAGVDLAAETRDYYRVEDEEGRRYWLFRRGLYDSPGYAGTVPENPDQASTDGRPGWFIHGLFG
ncbi:MAG: Y-family DNA polymerase [Geminicoccaceae bacterium]